jgi:meso-butanediol dehydrogenase/(S,S)-butanediol dehydrogenase/diacetyl reductase
MGRFEDKVVLLTGAASGIGAAAAQGFHAEGARLWLGDLDAERLSAFAQGLDAGGERVGCQAVDVADLEAVEAFTRAGAERFGRLDVLVNNAGIGAFGRTPELDPAVWHRTIDVDLHGVFYGCRAGIPHLRAAGGGAIVNTASISGLGGDSGMAAYNAAKGAVVNYTRTLAIDHAREGIRANAVCPGVIDTPLTDVLMGHEGLHGTALLRPLPGGRLSAASPRRTPVAARGAASGNGGGLLAPAEQQQQRHHQTRRRRLEHDRVAGPLGEQAQRERAGREAHVERGLEQRHHLAALVGSDQ